MRDKKAEIVANKKCTNASLMLLVLHTESIGICVSHNVSSVNYDVLTIKELSHFVVNGIIISGVGRIRPIMGHIQSCFPIMGSFSGKYGLLRPIHF